MAEEESFSGEEPYIFTLLSTYWMKKALQEIGKIININTNSFFSFVYVSTDNGSRETS